MNNHSVISIDLAKNVFQVCLLNQHNRVTSNKKVSRKKLLDSISKLDAKRVVMEACYSSNYWGRILQNLGYTADLIPPNQVKPFVLGNKNDHNDAIAIAKASLRPKARFVAVKSLPQQDIQSLDRIRDRLIRTRTSIANQLRGLLAEYGVITKKTLLALRKCIQMRSRMLKPTHRYRS
jgi:transposase